MIVVKWNERVSTENEKQMLGPCSLRRARVGWAQALIFMVALFFDAPVAAQSADESDRSTPAQSVTLNGVKLPLVFSEDFEKGRGRWQTTDDNVWGLQKQEKLGVRNHVFGLKERKCDYQPKFRSPHNIALIKDLSLRDFVLTFDVKSTLDTGNHRDCCIFFCHKNPTQFYYAHLGAKPDRASGQIMIVDQADRTPISQNKNHVPWDDQWHRVKVTFSSATGAIAVYFDDMKTPHMAAINANFKGGQLGLGSFDDRNDFDNVLVYGR